MDPYGNYDSLLIQPRNRPPYRVEEVAGLMPYRLRIENSYMGFPWHPLSLPLMKRTDCRDCGLAFFDLVALVDISPGVFDGVDVRNLQSFVETGGSLLLFGGRYSLGNSRVAYTGWESLLPVAIERAARRFDEPTLPTLRGEFAKLEGDLGEFGGIAEVQAVRPHADATVLAEAGGMPLIVGAQLGRGRVMIVTAYPDPSVGAVRDGRIRKETFFGSDGYVNLLGICLSWLMRRDHDLQVLGFAAPAGDVPQGEDALVSIAPRTLASGEAEFCLHHAGDEITLDRDPQFGAPVAEARGPVRRGQTQTWGGGAGPLAPGAYRARVRIEGDQDAGGSYTYFNNSYYNITAPPDTQNAKAMRVATWNVLKEVGIRAYPVGLHNTVAALDELEVKVEPIGAVPDGATVCASLYRRRDEEASCVARGLPVGTTIRCPVPNLQPDDYTLDVALEHRGRDLDRVRIPIVVVPPLREEETLFCVVGQSTSSCSMRGLREWFDEMVAAGFNCFTLQDAGCLSMARQTGTGHDNALASYWEELVQKSGFPMWAEYSRCVILATHGWTGADGEKPTLPCPHTDAYRQEARRFVRDLMASTRYVPRLISMEILDEPHLYAANVDYGPEARDYYRRTYGCEKPSWAEHLALKDRRRLHYFQSVVDYASLCFKASYDEVNEYLRETDRRFPLLHQVYAQGGIHHPGCSVFDQLEWSRYCHSVEFDSYPWIYANFRAGETLRMAEPRYYFAYYRVLCEHLGKPMGFFLDTADQYYPQYVWPLTSASELLYLAAGSGAKRLHTMFIRPMAMQAPRYEKEVQFAKDLRRVMEVAPLLAVARPARTELGVLNAWAHRLYHPPAPQLPDGFEGLGFYSMRSRPLDTIVPNWVEPLNGHEALYRALGCVPDVVDERILEAELPRYRAFALLGGVKTMFARSFDLLWEFVRGGGSLIMDGVPCSTPEGAQDRRF
ncbi:MAG TPA: hypothetical protein VMZ50_08765, partial [Phycisphaerae bacterium]|nr:hypothetical protein [Phycisphaerae bacterium]